MERKNSFIKPILNSTFKSDKFLTMDLETRKINGILSPYAVCLFDGKETIYFYISDYNNPDERLIAVINYLMKRKYNQYKISLHNLPYF